jgi:hypothetical protein
LNYAPEQQNVGFKKGSFYDKWMQIVFFQEPASESVFERIGFGAGIDVCLAGVCVAPGPNTTNDTQELPRDRGDAVQRFLGVESIHGQLRQVHLSAVVIRRARRWRHHKDVAENSHESQLDPHDFPGDDLHV